MNNLSEQPWICVVTHGNFGKELVKSAEMIVGKIDNVYCFSLMEGMSPEQLYDDIATQLANAPANNIILTDIYGGTPSNVSAIFAKKYQYLVLSGVNLPMLIEIDMSRNDIHSSQLSDRAIDVGIQSIKNITKIINKRESV